MNYAAYGLRLTSSFDLPGMEAATTDATDQLPPLSLTLQKPEELEQAWSGASGPPEWRGRLGDGLDLVIERGAAGDLLFSYGDRARFRLHADEAGLDCAPAHPGLDWQRALITKVIPSISVMRGYEALHAAVVDAPEGVVAIMAPSGSGKSTLAMELLSRGWPLFADDMLTLDQPEGAVRAHPGTPHMNLGESLPNGIDPETLGSTVAILAGERWLSAHATTVRPRPVRMLCLLERVAGLSLAAHTLPANPLLLAPYMLGLSTDIERQRSRFRLYADLMESATLVRLTSGLDDAPEQLADLIGQALLHRPALAAGAIR